MGDLELVLQQPFLAPHAPTIAYQRTVAAYYPVTGYDNSDLVLAIGTGRSPDHFGVAQPLGQVHITDGFSIADTVEFAPYLYLAIRSVLVYGQIEIAA